MTMTGDTAVSEMANNVPGKTPILRALPAPNTIEADLTLSIEEPKQNNSNGPNTEQQGNGATSITAPSTAVAPTTTILSLPTELRISILQYAILETFHNDYNTYNYGGKSYPLPAARMICRILRREARTAFSRSLRIETKYLQAFGSMIERDSLPSMRQWEDEVGMGLPLSLRNYELDVRIMQHRAMMLMWV